MINVKQNVWLLLSIAYCHRFVNTYRVIGCKVHIKGWSRAFILYRSSGERNDRERDEMQLEGKETNFAYILPILVTSLKDKFAAKWLKLSVRPADTSTHVQQLLNCFNDRRLHKASHAVIFLTIMQQCKHFQQNSFSEKLERNLQSTKTLFWTCFENGFFPTSVSCTKDTNTACTVDGTNWLVQHPVVWNSKIVVTPHVWSQEHLTFWLSRKLLCCCP